MTITAGITYQSVTVYQRASIMYAVSESDENLCLMGLTRDPQITICINSRQLTCRLHTYWARMNTVTTVPSTIARLKPITPTRQFIGAAVL